MAQELHPHCSANAPKLDSKCGRGHVVTLGGLSTYVSGPSTAKQSILLIADVFGYEAPNLRKLADKVGGSGYYAVVPDFLHGEPYDSTKKTWQQWNDDHPMDKMIEDAKTVVEALKDKGISKIGATSFCWAAQIAVGLTTPHYIDAAVLFHPAFLKYSDILGVKVPISILGAENDVVTLQEVVKNYEKILEVKNLIETLDPVDYFVKIFPGVAHGFAIRYDPNDKEAAAKADEAHQDMSDWFDAYVGTTSSTPINKVRKATKYGINVL